MNRVMSGKNIFLNLEIKVLIRVRKIKNSRISHKKLYNLLLDDISCFKSYTFYNYML